MTRIGIIGVTIGGNMGGQAMLEATLDVMRRRCPGASFSLFSIDPATDRTLNRHPDLEIVSAKPWILMGPGLLLALLIYGLRPKSGLLKIAPVYLRRWAECDAMIDLSGIAFVKGRGLALLVYNGAVCLPSFALDVPHHKLSQALGPFGWGRRIAAFVFHHCTSLIARGETTQRHLRELGFSVPVLPDVSFALEMTPGNREDASTWLKTSGIETSFIAVSPSRVVEKICAHEGKDYLGELASFCRALIEDGFEILILPHSLSSGRSKNNDLQVATRLAERLQGLEEVKILRVPPDARILRALFGLSRCVVTSRFHAAVAAVSMEVPVVTIGWSHKYQELLAPFGMDAFILKAEHISAGKLVTLWHDLKAREPALRTALAEASRRCRQEAGKNFDSVAAQLKDTA